jgi:Rieske 2Fe-2S family protein
VYFPWKITYHFVENERWEDKHSGEGKGFSNETRTMFPRTTALIRSLPFVEIGRALLFGLEAYAHAPAHRDSEPGVAETIAQSISLCPRKNKRFFLETPDRSARAYTATRAYWFNDMDYHGVAADPFFRYSIRVDGVLEPAFLKRARDLAMRR